MSRYSDRNKSNWFVPGLVATCFCALLGWQLDWFPLKVAKTETGQLLSEISSRPDEAASPFMDDQLADTSADARANQDVPDFTAELETFGAVPAEDLKLPAQSEPGSVGENTFGFADTETGGETATLEAPAEFIPDSDPFNIGSAEPTGDNPFATQEEPADLRANEFAAQPESNVQPASAAFAQPETTHFDTPSNTIQHADYSAVSLPAGGLAEPAAPEATTRPNAFKARETPQVIATTEIKDRIALIDRLLDESDYLTAHSELSKIYWQQPEFRSLIITRIEDTAQSIYASPQPHFIKPYVVQPGDQLRKIAQKYKVPWQYLAALNRVDERKVRAGSKLKVNKGPFSAVVDLSDFELTIHAHGFFVHRYSVGIGKNGTSPIGKFKVKQKLTNPTYYGPDGLVIDADDERNPLGEHWIDLGDSYGIHGTIDPDSIGEARSRGCIRMRNSDVAEVFNLLVEGCEVVIRR